jgi:hypothetical protein
MVTVTNLPHHQGILTPGHSPIIPASIQWWRAVEYWGGILMLEQGMRSFAPREAVRDQVHIDHHFFYFVMAVLKRSEIRLVLVHDEQLVDGRPYWYNVK